ncbi:SPFH domain-containing protein [Thioalkalivibrio sp. XN279]|uniref:SPFH domain-containing protein n=1 Tax=Thioalkalivibrio sp. XN279 TaxID=2714953 RepID=UPI00140E6B4B|nr:SPFH domain-containing protein [Thioalkalivibrio sp. XN279]
MVEERDYRPLSGWLPLAVVIVLLVGGPWYFFYSIQAGASGWPIAGSIVALAVGLVMIFGFMAIAPNDSRVLLLFGEYKGSVRASGFFWVNPFFSKKKLSLRVRNFETGSLSTPEKKDAAGKVVQERTRTHGRPSKVNDRDGNPIDISAVVVWRVVNTVEALFEVDDYEDFVAVQSEAALRSMASRYPYDSEDHEISLRGDTSKISGQLRDDIQERLDKAGVEVIEARISHLAYASEIAAAMLQRQQAQAVVAARTKIVEGAVGMVQMALDHLARDQVVELDDERRAAMVSNLLVVLCSDRHTQPVVNTGTLYS